MAFAGLLVATFANYALNELGHDEGMFLGASYLTVNHDLYTQVGYFQAPNLPLFLSRFYAWTHVSHFLMWGRVITFIHHALTLALLGAISLHLTRSAGVSTVFVIALGLNGFFYGAGYSIDNTTFASTYLVAGYYVLLRAHARDWRASSLVAASGFLVALASGFKLNYIPFLVCFVAVVGWFSTRRSLAAFLAGALIGSTPMIYLSIARGPAFWFANVGWHRRLLSMNVEEIGLSGVVAGFARDAWFYLVHPNWLAIPVLLVVIAIVLVRREKRPGWSFEWTLPILLTATSLVTIGGLGAVRFWYLQPTVVLGTLLLPSVYPQLRPKRQTVLRAALGAAAVAGILMQTSSLSNGLGVLDTDRWAPLQYSVTGIDVASLLSERRAQSVAAIGNPAIVYGVEGALPLLPSAATGAFVRVSSLMMGPLSRSDETIATFAGLSRSEPEMVIATVDYVLPRTQVAADAWCRPDRPDGSFDELFDHLCDSGYRRAMVGEGPARAVVFYRE